MAASTGGKRSTTSYEELNRDAGTRKAPEGLSDCHTGQQVGYDEALLNVDQVAAMLNVRRKRVYELGIPCARLSPMTIRWRRQDVLDWVASRRTGR
jgi:predicted DNA-binding transcriptional regulator AlpA